MVRSSKKKKKRGGGNSGRRGQLKDHGSNDDEENELLSEEITALSAIFQEDCEVVSSSSRSPPQIVIKLRPYSKDMGYEDTDISAMLLVRCLPGYPYKCPKLQITPEQGLTTADAEKLLSLLQDQANSNAREGRVMIFNLVEAAQEFLSEILPDSHDNESRKQRRWLLVDAAGDRRKMKIRDFISSSILACSNSRRRSRTSDYSGDLRGNCTIH